MDRTVKRTHPRAPFPLKSPTVRFSLAFPPNKGHHNLLRVLRHASPPDSSIHRTCDRMPHPLRSQGRLESRFTRVNPLFTCVSRVREDMYLKMKALEGQNRQKKPHPFPVLFHTPQEPSPVSLTRVTLPLSLSRRPRGGKVRWRSSRFPEL